MAGQYRTAAPALMGERWLEMWRNRRQGRGVREALRTVEDALVDAG